MPLTDEHRDALGAAFRYMRLRRFGDSKKAAYTAARVNAATWERLEGGLSVKPPTLSKVLLNLVPESEGDWEQLTWTSTEDGGLRLALPIETLSGARVAGEQYVGAGERFGREVGDAALVRQLRDELRSLSSQYHQGIADVRENVSILSARLTMLERARAERARADESDALAQPLDDFVAGESSKDEDSGDRSKPA